MKAKELNSLTSQELKSKLADLKTELFNLRFQMATGQLENSSRLKLVKRDIARVMTKIRESELKA